MSMMAAIDLAVLLQLVQDKPDHCQEYGRLMGGTAANGLQFDEPGMETFLQKVSRRLKFDTPVVMYDWTKTNAAKCLRVNRDGLIDLIVKDSIVAKDTTTAAKS